MATFVLDNCIDNVDIRKPNLQNQINIPYKLPTFFEEKLSKLMDILGLNTGSFDIIKGTDSNLYFLEINPVGIFDNVSYYCNYYLEKKIADYLYT